MALATLRFLSLVLNALASGVVLSHVLERPGKLSLAPTTYVEVQQKLFKTYGVAVGMLETDTSGIKAADHNSCMVPSPVIRGSDPRATE